jgi:hypothetical protein
MLNDVPEPADALVVATVIPVTAELVWPPAEFPAIELP